MVTRKIESRSRYSLAAFVFFCLGVYIIYPRIEYIEANLNFHILYFFYFFGFSALFLTYKFRFYSYASFVTAIFFVISYVDRIFQVIEPDTFINVGGDRTTGSFDLSGESIQLFVWYSIAGLLFFQFGMYLGGLVCKPKNLQPQLSTLEVLYSKYLKVAKFRAIVVLSCYVIGVGISGVQSPILPFKLTGILVYLNSILLPVLMLFLTALILSNSTPKNMITFTKSILYLLLFSGIVAILFKTKAGIMYVFVPLVLTMINSDFYRRDVQKSVVKYMFSLLVVSCFSFIIVEFLRGDPNCSTDCFDAFMDFLNVYKLGNDNLNIFNVIINSIMARITGGSELMAVIGSNEQYEYVFIRLLYDTGYIYNVFPGVIKEIFSVNVGIDGDNFVGKSIGLFGVFALQRSVVYYALGLSTLGFFVGIIEAFVKAKTNRLISSLYIFYIVLNLWESGFDILFLYLLTLPIIVLLYKRITTEKCDYVH